MVIYFFTSYFACAIKWEVDKNRMLTKIEKEFLPILINPKDLSILWSLILHNTIVLQIGLD